MQGKLGHHGGYKARSTVTRPTFVNAEDPRLRVRGAQGNYGTWADMRPGVYQCPCWEGHTKVVIRPRLGL